MSRFEADLSAPCDAANGASACAGSLAGAADQALHEPDWEQLSARVEAEQVQMVYDNIRVALGGQLVAAVLLSAVGSTVVPQQAGIVWIGVLALATLIRWRIASRFHAGSSGSWDPRLWRRRAVLGSAVSGVLWGLGGILLVTYGDGSLHALAGLVLGGLAAGAVATSSAVRANYVAFAVPMVGMLAGGFLAYGGSQALAMGGFALVFLFAMFRSATQVGETYERDIRLKESLTRSNLELEREIDERRRAEGALRQSEGALQEAQRIGQVASWVIELPSNRVHGSAQLGRLYEDESVLDTTFDWIVDRTHPEDRSALVQAYQQALARHGPVEVVYRLPMGEGGTKYIHARGETVRDAQGNAVQLFGTCQDITETRKAEEQLRLSAQVFESGVEGVMITDPAGRIVSVNRAFTKITGYSEDEALGRNPRILQSGRQDRAFYEHMWTALKALGYWRGEMWDKRKSGELYPAWFTISSVKDPEGRLTHYVAVFSDISERKAAEERIEYLAHHDSLTGLPNRAVLRDRFEQALALARRDQAKVALAFVDLDHFKAVNDSLGHSSGDELLCEVARRLKACVRGSDTVCRQGGDEFLLLLVSVPDPHSASVVANKVLAMLREPLDIGGHSLVCNASIGISVYPDDGGTFDALLQKADMAMYEAKGSGRNGYRFFSSDMNTNVLERLQMQNLLRLALERKEFLLHYQPQVDLETGRILGVEALLRWDSPDLGRVPPGRFIPIAEESGLIVEIGAWTLATACRQNRAWQDLGLPTIPVAVNLSALQFSRGDLLATVEEALAESGLAGSYLELELTESVLINDEHKILAKMTRLKELGVKLSIDDFGTGYSSLSYLKRLAVDKLKIDQSFVRDLVSDPDDAAIVRAIIQMGQSLKLSTIAEGVETEAQLTFLRAAGCREGQGYLFGRPVCADELQKVLMSAPNASAVEFMDDSCEPATSG